MGAITDSELLLLAAQISALEARARETAEASARALERVRAGEGTEEVLEAARDAEADIAEELAALYKRSARHADRLALLLGAVEDELALGEGVELEPRETWIGGIFGRVRSALA